MSEAIRTDKCITNSMDFFSSFKDRSKIFSIMKQIGISRKSQQQIKAAAKQVVKSRESACMFLKSAGIMTSKGNLSPKYK